MAKNKIFDMKNFAKELALALADEVIFLGEDNCTEQSIKLLAQARERLELSEEFDRLDSLKCGVNEARLKC